MSYIDKIIHLFPPYFRCKKNYWLAKKEKIEIPGNKRIFIFLAANYGNLGDVAITYAQHKILHLWMPDRTIIEVPSNCSYSYLKSVVKQIKKNDIVTFVGGGNMGDMYPLYENLRQIIVSELPHNRILQFPITADFSSKSEGLQMLKYARKIYSKHKNLQILARESKTAQCLSVLLNKEIPLVPDVVLTLDYFIQGNHRTGISVCLRKDNEKILGCKDEESIKSMIMQCDQPINYTDTVIDDKLITLGNKENYLNELLRSFSEKKLIITDRLHGMIFAYITGTPAIVFSNSNGKVEKCYDWIKESGFIYYTEKYEKQQFLELLNLALKVKPNKQMFDEKRSLFISIILNAL